MIFPASLRVPLIYAAKNAVNAALLSGAMIYHDSKDYNWHTRHGAYGILWVLFSAVAARELSIWGPKLMRWSQTNGS